MSIIHEQRRAGEFLLSEANGKLSREKITVTGGNYPAGQVLARQADGRHTAYDPEGDAPLNTAAALLFAPTDASEADQSGIGIVRLAEVSAALLVDADQQALTDLSAQFIIAR